MMTKGAKITIIAKMTKMTTTTKMTNMMRRERLARRRTDFYMLAQDNYTVQSCAYLIQRTVAMGRIDSRSSRKTCAAALPPIDRRSITAD